MALPPHARGVELATVLGPVEDRFATQFDEDGRVLVVDQWFRKIDVYRPAGLSEKSGFLARPVVVAK